MCCLMEGLESCAFVVNLLRDAAPPGSRMKSRDLNMDRIQDL